MGQNLAPPAQYFMHQNSALIEVWVRNGEKVVMTNVGGVPWVNLQGCTKIYVGHSPLFSTLEPMLC